MPPQTKTFPSGSKTALQRLRCSPSGNAIAAPQFTAGDSAATLISSYVLLVEGSEPPTAKIWIYGGVLLSNITDIPFVRSGIVGETGAILFHTPTVSPVNVK